MDMGMDMDIGMYLDMDIDLNMDIICLKQRLRRLVSF
jgi:hypothetical protein